MDRGSGKETRPKGEKQEKLYQKPKLIKYKQVKKKMIWAQDTATVDTG